MIDFFSIVPIDVILANYQDFNKLLRLVRIGKMYKLVRLFRLVKILKLVKSNKRLMNQFSEKMRISAGTERLAFFSVFFVIFLHVSSCLFIMIGKSNNDDEPSWLDSFTDKADEEVFVCSIYFVLTTTSTVGYGDITPVNTIERLYGCALMLIGVLSFTFISGALSSILSSYDSRQAQLQEKVLQLNKLRTQFTIPDNLYQEIRQALNNEAQKSDAYLDEIY